MEARNSLVLETLHLWECPRYYPNVGLGLELAWLADPTVSWEGAISRQRSRQRQWWKEGKTQLRFISRHKNLRKKSKHKSDSTLLSGRSKCDFHDKHNQSKLFESHLGEIWVISRRWGESGLSVQLAVSRAESIEAEDLGGLFLMGWVEGSAHVYLQTLGPI